MILKVLDRCKHFDTKVEISYIKFSGYDTHILCRKQRWMCDICTVLHQAVLVVHLVSLSQDYHIVTSHCDLSLNVFISWRWEPDWPHLVGTSSAQHLTRTAFSNNSLTYVTGYYAPWNYKRRLGLKFKLTYICALAKLNFNSCMHHLRGIL